MVQMREMAWRIFAVEINSSTLEHQEEGDKAPLYLISPLGAKVNRVLIAGVITDVENTGTDTEPMWRARMSDPTGVFYISAGQYQPQASQALAAIKPPEFAAVVGKVRTYKPEAGVMYISIRPEVVKVVDSKRRDAWVFDTCLHMRTRISAMREAMAMEPFDPEKMISLGYGQGLVEGISMATKHYTSTDLDRYSRVMTESLRYLLPESGERLLEPRITVSSKGDYGVPSLPPDKAQVRIEEMDKDDANDEITPEEESAILEIIADLEEQADDGLALWQDIIDNAVTEGIDRDRAEEAINVLQAKGDLTEPTIGKIKRV
jgi:RPA family protein